MAVSVACMAIYDLLQALQGEPLNSVFSPDETLISASAAPHWGIDNDDMIILIMVVMLMVRTMENEGDDDDYHRCSRLKGQNENG